MKHRSLPISLERFSLHFVRGNSVINECFVEIRIQGSTNRVTSKLGGLSEWDSRQWHWHSLRSWQLLSLRLGEDAVSHRDLRDHCYHRIGDFSRVPMWRSRDYSFLSRGYQNPTNPILKRQRNARRPRRKETNNEPQSSLVSENDGGLTVVGGKEKICAAEARVFDEIDGIGDGDDEAWAWYDDRIWDLGIYSSIESSSKRRKTFTPWHLSADVPFELRSSVLKESRLSSRSCSLIECAWSWLDEWAFTVV